MPLMLAPFKEIFAMIDDAEVSFILPLYTASCEIFLPPSIVVTYFNLNTSLSLSSIERIGNAFFSFIQS
jgi:hypothetical protein